MPNLHRFSLKLRGVPLGDAYRKAITDSLSDAADTNRKLFQVSVQLVDGGMLADSGWSRRVMENQCYAPR
jgi:hypothetical protein